MILSAACCCFRRSRLQIFCISLAELCRPASTGAGRGISGAAKVGVGVARLALGDGGSSA